MNVALQLYYSICQRAGNETEVGVTHTNVKRTSGQNVPLLQFDFFHMNAGELLTAAALLYAVIVICKDIDRMLCVSCLIILPIQRQLDWAEIGRTGCCFGRRNSNSDFLALTIIMR